MASSAAAADEGMSDAQLEMWRHREARMVVELKKGHADSSSRRGPKPEDVKRFRVPAKRRPPAPWPVTLKDVRTVIRTEEERRRAKFLAESAPRPTAREMFDAETQVLRNRITGLGVKSAVNVVGKDVSYGVAMISSHDAGKKLECKIKKNELAKKAMGSISLKVFGKLVTLSTASIGIGGAAYDQFLSDKNDGQVAREYHRDVLDHFTRGRLEDKERIVELEKKVHQLMNEKSSKDNDPRITELENKVAQLLSKKSGGGGEGSDDSN